MFFEPRTTMSSSKKKKDKKGKINGTSPPGFVPGIVSTEEKNIKR